MSRSLKWLPEALDDLVRLREFIRVHNPEAAERSAKRILATTQRLLDFPLIGRPVMDINKSTFRDLFIPFGQAGYWMRYTVKDEAIIIIRVWHGRENKEETEFGENDW